MRRQLWLDLKIIEKLEREGKVSAVCAYALLTVTLVELIKEQRGVGGEVVGEIAKTLDFAGMNL
ncbi:hypothetical protein FACS1894188_07280 [Clostridia bacterium]|nr:hypothetical protein FACS1894188_07280 [Clostridia bacterium]